MRLRLEDEPPARVYQFKTAVGHVQNRAQLRLYALNGHFHGSLSGLPEQVLGRKGQILQVG